MNAPHRSQRFAPRWPVGGGAVLLGSLIMMILLSGCGSKGHRPVRTAMVPFSPDQQAELARVQDAEYRLRPGDRIAIDFKYEDDLDSTDLLILPDGRVTLPGGVGPVMARGHSVTELTGALTELYARDYRHPQLSIVVESLADLDIFVLGMVRDPGVVKLPPGGMGVLQAIAAAGGFEASARSQETVLMRVTPDGFMLRQIDLSHLQRRGFLELAELDLQPYDIIYVPRSSLGDLKYFSDTVLASLTNVTRLFWDVYAISNLNKVQNIWR